MILRGFSRQQARVILVRTFGGREIRWQAIPYRWQCSHASVVSFGFEYSHLYKVSDAPDSDQAPAYETRLHDCLTHRIRCARQ
jgi:hypothetical protein